MESNGVWYSQETCSIDEFKRCVSNDTSAKKLKFADDMTNRIPVYDCHHLRKLTGTIASKRDVMTELAAVLMEGAGIFVMKNAFTDLVAVDDATRVFNDIIEQERGIVGNEDHFAKAGANDRIWNALEKLCLKAPDVFARYYANDMLALASEAWLGPAYQVTSQINVVRPGGEAQQPHCDYHLGFQTADMASLYPAHVHQLSRTLTLQGAVSHGHMPVESGPTKVLPYSQTYAAGYMAWRRPDFQEYFEANFVQMPLEKGDAMFFNPSLFHAAGSNRTNDIERMANLLQISSAYGIAMEAIDRRRMSLVLYPILQTALTSRKLTEQQLTYVIAAAAHGYSFPTNLDENPPAGGLAPKSQQMLLREALANNLDSKTLATLLK